MEEKSISLYFKEGTSDKIYKAELVKQIGGWVVNYSYGRRGTALKTGTKTPNPLEYEKALKIYTKLVNDKTGEGYLEGDENVAATATAKTPGDILAGMSAVNLKADTGLRPQLLNEISEYEVEKYINDPNWCAQEKFDGKRRMMIKEGIKVTATNRKGLVVIPSARISSGVAQLPDDVILDGEDMGEYMVIFDILKLGAKDLTKEGFITRDEALKKIIPYKKSSIENTDPLRTVYTAYTAGEKRMLFDKLKRTNAEGIVFKQIKSKYVPGRPNSYGYQLKFKFVKTASFIVTAVSEVKRSISVSVYNKEGVLTDVGSVTVYPNQIIPRIGTIVEVRYLYFFKGGSIYQPVLLGTGNVERDDIDAEACLITQLKIKRGDVDFGS